jgi:flagellar basal-body rod protein FlgG
MLLRKFGVILAILCLSLITACSSSSGVAPTSRPDYSAGAILRVADQSTGDLGELLRGIRTAEDIVFDNLRNADTVGFKGSISHNVGISSGIAVQLDLTQGSMNSTHRNLDVGIQGNGFFRVQVLSTIDDGTAYTRNGNFFINDQGQMVVGMGDGYKLIPPITIPVGITGITISQDGIVTGLKPGAASVTQIGQIQLSQFINPQALNQLGGSLFQENQTSGPHVDSKPGDGGAGQLLQNYLESSNVDVITECERLKFLRNWEEDVMRTMDDRVEKS